MKRGSEFKDVQSCLKVLSIVLCLIRMFFFFLNKHTDVYLTNKNSNHLKSLCHNGEGMMNLFLYICFLSLDLRNVDPGYNAAMSACEKALQWILVLHLLCLGLAQLLHPRERKSLCEF